VNLKIGSQTCKPVIQIFGERSAYFKLPKKEMILLSILISVVFKIFLRRGQGRQSWLEKSLRKISKGGSKENFLKFFFKN
jgi:hypothetical protein